MRLQTINELPVKVGDNLFLGRRLHLFYLHLFVAAIRAPFAGDAKREEGRARVKEHLVTLMQR